MTRGDILARSNAIYMPMPNHEQETKGGMILCQKTNKKQKQNPRAIAGSQANPARKRPPRWAGAWQHSSTKAQSHIRPSAHGASTSKTRPLLLTKLTHTPLPLHALPEPKPQHRTLPALGLRLPRTGIPRAGHPIPDSIVHGRTLEHIV